MNWTFLVIAAAIVAAILGLLPLLAKGGGKKAKDETPKARRPLTAHEQKLFFRITAAAPALIVLAQVSFNALLTARQYAARNTFNRKMADFVLCDKAFNVLAIIELDDATHDGKEKRDESRDLLLKTAGYQVIRWRGIPNDEEIKRAIAAVITKKITEKPAADT